LAAGLPTLDLNDPPVAEAVALQSARGDAAADSGGLVRLDSLSRKIKFFGVPPHALAALLAGVGGPGGRNLKGMTAKRLLRILGRYARGLGKRRHLLLQLRARRPQLFHAPIPLRDDQVAADPKLAALLADARPKGANAAIGGIGYSAGLGLAAGAGSRLTMSVAERVRAYLEKLGRRLQGRSVGNSLLDMSRGAGSFQRRLRTTDVVKDVALPVLRGLDLSFLAALFAPRRPLRP